MGGFTIGTDVLFFLYGGNAPLPCPYAVSSAMMNRASMLHDSRLSRSSPTSQHQMCVSCNRLVSLLLLCALDLRSTPQLLRTILALLALLPAGLLNLGCETVSDLSVVWLELLESLWRVVDQSETS